MKPLKKKSVLIKVKNLGKLIEPPYFKFFLIALINFIAHFWYFRDFGIYEDDHFRIPSFMTLNYSQGLELLWNFLTHPAQFQGRSLHESFILIGSFLGAHLGGLSSIYFIAYGLSTLNALLFYGLMKIITKNQTVTLLSTFFFILFPTDTNQIWLTSAFGIRPSLTFLFLAFICYLKNRKLLSYFIIFLSLFCYETVYWIFLFAPFFEKNLSIKKRLRNHIIFLSTIFLSVIILRKFLGESRISDLNFVQTAQMSLGQIGLGIGSIVMSYPEAFKSTGFATEKYNYLLFFMILSFLIFYWLLIKNTYKLKSLDFSVIKYSSIFVGMVIVSYPLNLTVWANQLSGVYTRVNMSASVGISALLGILSYQLLYWAQKRNYQHWFNIILSMSLAVLVGFGLTIQKDYQLNWQYQKTFWQEVISLIPDIKNGEIVLIDAQKITNLNTQQMRGNDWNTNVVLGNIFQFPYSAPASPKVFLLTSDWQKKILTDHDLLRMSTSTLIAAPAHLPTPNQESLMAPSSVILIQSDDQKLYRSFTQNIQGRTINFKPKSAPTLNKLPPGVLYPYIFDDVPLHQIPH